MSESSASPKPCPQCGAGLPSESTDGLCPRCMLSQAMNEPPDSEVLKATVPVSGPRKSWEPPGAEEMGRLLPQYRIERMLGRGGMGAVYQGRQVALDRVVAIKILSTALEDADASFVERFKNEARAMAKLSHPGIVTVHDFGETENGLLYIVMEFIEGTDVAKMIAGQGRLHSEHAMAITAHVCDALAYAHERGIIHRDIKPANIMVSYEGVVKVADFGLAKFSTTAGETLGLTQSGMAMGTLHFMAPEALTLGSAVDHRADIYAVGVMLYQMLTGKLPHGMFELPSIQVQGLDPRYDGIIARAMREDRALRYQTAREMRHDLDGILTQPVQQVEADPTRPQAALPVEARPRRSPAGKGKPVRPPQRDTPAPEQARKKSSAGLVLLTLGLLAVIGAALFFLDGQRKVPTAVPLPGDSGPAVSTAATTALTSATKDAPFVNTLGMKFVPVPGTNVLFCIHETRRQDYAAFAAEVPDLNASWKKRSWDGVPYANAENEPVAGVNWEEAEAFCAWLSKRENMTYRLPTDREWSHAVGIGHLERWREDTTPGMLSRKIENEYPWGNKLPPPDGAGNYADTTFHEQFPTRKYIQGYSDGFAMLAPVMSYAPNQFGIYDLGGNIAELVADWFDAEQKEKVLRGGAYTIENSSDLLSSMRRVAKPTEILRAETAHHGFRCVVQLAEAAPASSSASKPSSSPSPSLPVSSSFATATKDAPFTNTLGMKFVPVPGTKVLMCIHETRRQDYAAYAGQTPAVDGLWKNTTEEGIPVSDKDDHPVVSVNWDDVQAFCDWLSKKEGKVYRLPTDQEWSFAVGIGDDEIRNAETTPEMLNGKVAVFPWGTGLPPPAGAGNYADITLNQTTGNHRFIPDYTDGFATTAPVMSFTPNKLGLYDLGGNVWEWVEDWWNVDQKQRVCRGASFGPHGAQVYSSARYASWPHLRRSMFGFRLVTEVPVTDSKSAVPGKNQPLNASVPQTASATKDKPFVNTLGMKFVPVPITGGPTDKQRVLFSIWETRVQDYELFVKETKREWPKARFDQDPTHPATNITWSDAGAFCQWLTASERKAGTIGESEVYRLPSDHEWSCAVGIGEQEDAAKVPHDKDGKLADVYPWGGLAPAIQSRKLCWRRSGGGIGIESATDGQWWNQRIPG